MKNFNLNKLLFSLFICHLLLSAVSANTTCSIDENIDGSSCSVSQILTSSDFRIPSGTTIACIHQVVELFDQCNQDPDIVYFRAEGKYDGMTSSTIFEFLWSGSNNEFQMHTVSPTSTTTDLFDAVPSTQPTQAISYFVCFDFANGGKAAGGINTLDGRGAGTASITEYTSIGKIDDVVFYFCNNGTDSSTCGFYNTKISFPTSIPTNPFPYIWGIEATAVREYEMNENTGATLADKANGKDATFGSGTNSPVWSQTNYGVAFTKDNQYIKIPPFSMQTGDLVVTTSFTVSMWIKFQSLPTVSSYIIRRSTSDLSKDLFALMVDSTGKYSVSIGDATYQSSFPAATSEWQLISASVSMLADDKTYYASMAFNDIILGSAFDPLSTALTFSSNDQIRIGGPTGVLATMYKVKIYSPGSHLYSYYSCGSGTATTTFSIDYSPYLYQCISSCSKCYGPDATDCMSCATPGSSTSPYGLYNGICQACPAKTVLTDTKCTSCPSNCDICTSVGICTNCTTGYTLTSTGLCTAPTIENSFTRGAVSATKGGRTAADGTTQIATIASNGDPVGVQAQVSGRIFISIQYLKITYSQDVLAILAGTAATPGEGDPAYAPNMPSDVKEDITARSTPYAFNKYGLSSSFILNFWKKMMLLIIIFAVVLLTAAIEFIAIKRKWKFLPPQVFGFARQFPQSYMLSQLYSFLGDVVLYSTLQYRTLQFRSSSEWADFFVSMFFLAAVFSMPFWHFRFIMQYRRAKETAHFKKNKSILTFFQESNMGFKLFFDDFKDTFKRQQFFLMFLTGRDLIFSLILTTMFDHPLPQMIIWLILNIGMMTYLFLYKPFKNVFNLVQQIFYELLLFVALIVLLILISLDIRDSTDMTTRDVLGKIIIFESLLFSYGTIVITCLKIFFIGFEAFKEFKAKKAQTTQAKYASTEEIPAVEATSPENDGEIDVSPSHRPELKASGFTLATEEMSPQNQPYHSKTSSIQSNNKSSLLLLPTQTQFIPPDLESKKTIKLKKSKTPHPSNLNREKDVNEDDNSDVIDNLMINFGHEIDPNTPNNYSDTSPTKAFKFMKN